MNRFLTIVNNKLIADRFAYEIVDGEIEETEEYKDIKVGMICIDNIWQFDPKEIEEKNKQERIYELERIIDIKIRLGDDVTLERNEYRELLGY